MLTTIKTSFNTMVILQKSQMTPGEFGEFLDHAEINKAQLNETVQIDGEMETHSKPPVHNSLLTVPMR